MYLGSHVSFGKEQLLGSVKEALSYGANTFMFYTGAPQNTLRSPIDSKKTAEAKELMKDNNIDINKVICHAPYIINLANKKDPSKWDFSINFLKQEINRCEELGIKYIVVHPGSAVGISKEEGLKNISEALNYIISESDKCMILLETMAGKGNECASTIDEMKKILDNVNSCNIGVCLDTCHLHDAGYDIGIFEEYLKDFDNKIGISKINCLHINDSKNPLASHKDRHANIGFGTIGFENLLNVIYNEKLIEVPKILETPYVGKKLEDKEKNYPPYKFEIQMIKKKEYNNNLIEDINKEYQK